jgi:hypothetical protein
MLELSQRFRARERNVLATSLIFVLLVSLAIGTGSVARADSGDRSYSIRSTVTFVNPSGGTRIWNLTEEDRAVGLFMNNTWQSVELKSANYPLQTQKDSDGNIIGDLKLDKQQLRPGENITYTTEHFVISKPRIIPSISESEAGTTETIPYDLRGNYTRAEGSWLINDPPLVSLANSLAGNETKILNIIKNFVGWMKSNIEYTTHEFPLYPNETLSMREGDCDDQAILLVTLARILGIPSYVQVGAIYTPTSDFSEENVWDSHVHVVQRRIGWHGWAMVFVPPWGWLPVDLTYVLSGSPDPLDAIRYGAVTQQNTIQYMNFSKVDYVAESRESRNFILKNGFYLDMIDEMTKVETGGLLGNPVNSIAVVLGAGMFMLAVSLFLIVRRRRMRTEDRKVEVPTAHI